MSFWSKANVFMGFLLLKEMGIHTSRHAYTVCRAYKQTLTVTFIIIIYNATRLTICPKKGWTIILVVLSMTWNSPAQPYISSPTIILTKFPLYTLHMLMSIAFNHIIISYYTTYENIYPSTAFKLTEEKNHCFQNPAPVVYYDYEPGETVLHSASADERRKCLLRISVLIFNSL